MSCDFGFRAVSIPQEHTFLSYSRNDCEIVAPIAKLVSEKRPIWYDEGLVAGEKWESMIVEQVLSCKMALFFVSRDLLGRDGSYVYDEYLFVSNAPKPALCVWLDDLREFGGAALSGEMAELWQGLSALPAVSVYDKATAEEKANAVIAAMDELLKKDPTVPDRHELPQNETSTPSPKPEPKPEAAKHGGKLSKFLGSKLFKALAVAIPVAAAVAVGGTVAAQHFLGNDEPTVDENGHIYVETINDIDQINEDDIVVMGEFEGKPIEWIVLDKKDDDVLLITKEVLCWKYFEDSYGDNWEAVREIERNNREIIEDSEYCTVDKETVNVDWDNCSLRKWLNHEFANETFSVSELAHINNTTVVTPNVTVKPLDKNINTFGTHILNGGNSTKDKLFLLSTEEYYTYQSSISSIEGWWWLRSPGCYFWYDFDSVPVDGYTRYWVTVDQDHIQRAGFGKIEENDQYRKEENHDMYDYYLGRFIANDGGVRPAMWVHIGE